MALCPQGRWSTCVLGITRLMEKEIVRDLIDLYLAGFLAPGKRLLLVHAACRRGEKMKVFIQMNGVCILLLIYNSL